MAAAVLQIVFGLVRAGILGEFFPVSAVHGMLAAIGVIIIAKQIPVALGVTAKGEPLELLREIPHFLVEANPAIATIGLTSIAIMFLWPLVGRQFSAAKLIPSPVVVLVVAIPMGMGFDLLHQHSYTLQGHKYQLGEQYLVEMPDETFGMFDEITTPDFTALAQPKAWKWVFMFFIIGTLESVLSAKAIDLIDPWKRKTSMDRDIIGVGAGNLCVAMIGGLPMISEIVRSKANIDNGARTRFADLWHGMFLLLCVALIPFYIHSIPLAALAAMLVYTGFRLAHPMEFLNVLRIGREQLVIFVSTLVAVLATDLLIGIAIGIAVKAAIHIANGVPIRSLFKPDLEVTPEDHGTIRIVARQSAVFSNWIPVRRQIEQVGLQVHKNVILDLSATQLVDHSVMDKLREMESDFEQEDLEFHVVGLDAHQPLAKHEHSARKRVLGAMRRLTIVTDTEIEKELTKALFDSGASQVTRIECAGVKRTDGEFRRTEKVRLEAILAPPASNEIREELQTGWANGSAVELCIEPVDIAPAIGRQNAGVSSPASGNQLTRPRNPFGQ